MASDREDAIRGMTNYCRGNLQRTMEGEDLEFFHKRQHVIFSITFDGLTRVGLYQSPLSKAWYELGQPIEPFKIYLDFFIDQYRKLIAQGKKFILDEEEDQDELLDSQIMNDPRYSDATRSYGYSHDYSMFGHDIDNRYNSDTFFVLISQYLRDGYEKHIVKETFLSLYSIMPERMDEYAREHVGKYDLGGSMYIEFLKSQGKK